MIPSPSKTAEFLAEAINQNLLVAINVVAVSLIIVPAVLDNVFTLPMYLTVPVTLAVTAVTITTWVSYLLKPVDQAWLHTKFARIGDPDVVKLLNAELQRQLDCDRTITRYDVITARSRVLQHVQNERALRAQRDMLGGS